MIAGWRDKPWLEARDSIWGIESGQSRPSIHGLDSHPNGARVFNPRLHRQFSRLQSKCAYMLCDVGGWLIHDALRQRTDLVANVGRVPKPKGETSSHKVQVDVATC